MPRIGHDQHGEIPFTAAQEAARDAEEAAEIIAATARDSMGALLATETLGSVARKLEDVIDSITNGTTLPAAALAWAADRKTKRAKL